MNACFDRCFSWLHVEMAKGTEIAPYLWVYDVQWQVTPVRELTTSRTRWKHTFRCPCGYPKHRESKPSLHS